MSLSPFKKSRLLLVTIALLGLVSPFGNLVLASCPGIKTFTASGSGSNSSEARKNAIKKLKKKIAAYKKKHPGCKVKIKL